MFNTKLNYYCEVRTYFRGISVVVVLPVGNTTYDNDKNILIIPVYIGKYC